jgi:predicted RNA binding protein YcfA (HicA-like mRNA interferase family)
MSVPNLPELPYRDVIARLHDFGFAIKRQKGSHVTLQKITPHGTLGCVVPKHSTVSPGTLRQILHQARISPEEFIKS